MPPKNQATLAPNNNGTEPALRVVARPPTFRRAGFEFGPDAQYIPLRVLTDEQIEAIESEPELVTTRISLPVDPASP